MDRLFIEMRSINKLEDILTRTERIQPNIQKNDKIPSWDGEVIVYKSKDINKSNILGVVRVQVKGSLQDDLGRDEIKFQVDKSDLENYKNNDACIFFVVYMKNLDEFKIYYNILLPYDLKLIFDSMDEKQQTKVLTFKEYPSSDIELQMKIYRSFIYNRNKQIGTVNASFGFKEVDAEKSKLIENYNFTFFQTGKDLSDMFNSAFKIPTYIYANTMGGKVSIPIEKIKVEEIKTCKLPYKVCLNGKCYFDTIQINKKQDDEELLFGNEFCISKRDEKLSFEIKGTLNDRIQNYKFLIDLCKKGKKNFTIDNCFEAELEDNFINDNIENKKKTLEHLQEIKEALNKIGVVEELQCDNLSDSDESNINLLLNNIIKGELLDIKEDIPKIAVIQISNISFPVVIDNVKSNWYKLESLFNMENVMITDANEEKINALLAMDEKCFLNFSNIDYTHVKSEITSNLYSKNIEGWVTNFILQGLLAYDKNNNQELYDCLYKISRWQIENSPNHINYLNFFQIIKRHRELNLDEISKLNDIKNETNNNEIKLGACIILESKSEIKLYWSLLNEKEKNKFKEYPIYHFTKL